MRGGRSTSLAVPVLLCSAFLFPPFGPSSAGGLLFSYHPPRRSLKADTEQLSSFNTSSEEGVRGPGGSFAGDHDPGGDDFLEFTSPADSFASADEEEEHLTTTSDPPMRRTTYSHSIPEGTLPGELLLANAEEVLPDEPELLLPNAESGDPEQESADEDPMMHALSSWFEREGMISEGGGRQEAAEQARQDFRRSMDQQLTARVEAKLKRRKSGNGRNRWGERGFIEEVEEEEIGFSEMPSALVQFQRNRVTLVEKGKNRIKLLRLGSRLALRIFAKQKAFWDDAWKTVGESSQKEFWDDAWKTVGESSLNKKVLGTMRGKR